MSEVGPALHLDFETRSFAALDRVGANRYAEDPTTDVMCLAWRFGSNPTDHWSPGAAALSSGIGASLFAPSGGPPDPESIERFAAQAATAARVVAHNAGFERAIWRHCLPEIPLPPLERWDCTAARAAAIGLPRSLEHAAFVLGLEMQKDKAGKLLMVSLSNPLPKKKGGGFRPVSQEELDRLVAYCVQDVAVESELDRILPPLHPLDRAAWLCDMTVNERGALFDREHCESALATMREIEATVLPRFAELTGVTSVHMHQRLLDWMQAQGAGIFDVQAETMDHVAADPRMPPEVREAARLRRILSRSSVKKYEAALERRCRDGRGRDLFIFHGTSTGRWTGAGFQPQNLPRGKIKDADVAAWTIAKRDPALCEALYGDPTELLSHAVRGTVVAPEGQVLTVCDWSSIEARILAWTAGDEALLEDFRAGRGVYENMARQIYELPPDAPVTSDQRFLGKSSILGLGFQMGEDRFMENCAQQGRPVPRALIQRAVKAYRGRFKDTICASWSKVEDAAIAAMRDPAARGFTTSRCTWFRTTSAGLPVLCCRLPSGRRLHYWQPSIRERMTPWKEMRPALHFWARDAKTGQWGEEDSYGGKLVENFVSGIARDVLAYAIPRVEAAGMPVSLHVHDEIVTETEGDRVAELEALMTALPSWAEGLPLAAAGWSGTRYRK